MVNVLTEIQAEENIHIGQLQELMKLVDPNASKIEDGQVEGEEQLANPGTDGQATIDSGILEDINNMTKPEAQAFDRAVREKWRMSPLEFMQEYMANITLPSETAERRITASAFLLRI